MFVALTNELISIDGYFIVVFIFYFVLIICIVFCFCFVFVAGCVLPKSFHPFERADNFELRMYASVYAIGNAQGVPLLKFVWCLTLHCSTLLRLLSKRIIFVYVRFKFHLWDIVCVSVLFFLHFQSFLFHPPHK